MNNTSPDGMTPLIMATRVNCTPIVKLLIEAGANLDASDFRGKTAFEIALEKENADIAELLHPKQLNDPENNLPFAEALECLGSYITFIYNIL